ncbi:MAG: NAD(P)-dependent oxidoreductase [Lachnospiraceae bacterium]
MDTAIITGANGLIGKNLVEKLSNKGYHVYAIVRNQNENISILQQLSNVEIIYCDLEEISNLEYLIENRVFNFFFHLAWEGSSGKDREDHEIQLKNVSAFCNAAKVSAILGCKKFLGIGSVVELSVHDAMINEYFRPELTAQYAFAKIASNYMSRCICTDLNISFNWAYISNLYGVGDKTNNIISYVIRHYLKNESPGLTEGNQLADFIEVSDVASALIAIAEKGNAGAAYYVGGSNIKPLKDFILQIRNKINPNLDSGLGRKSFNGQSINYSNINIDRLEKDTGFKPEISFDDGITKMINWIKNKRDVIL